jgi:hypothetical protein
MSVIGTRIWRNSISAQLIVATTASHIILRNLPPEIQSRILELCSPSDLAVMSRVHTSLQNMAEYTLYSRIQYRARSFDLLKSSRDVANFDEDTLVSPELRENKSLLHTFANNSRKASMVKMLYVELEDGLSSEEEFEWEEKFDEDTEDDSKATQFILVKLAERLVKMPNLVDLRIIHGFLAMDNFDSIKPGAQRISEVIRFVFRSGVNDSD